MKPYIDIFYDDKVAVVTFFNQQSNSFSSEQLKQLSEVFDELSNNINITVVVLKSDGKTFCAGASFDELLKINDIETSQEFFCGFGRLLNSMKNCKKTIISETPLDIFWSF